MIRLVIFDMGFTLWDEVPDERAILGRPLVNEDEDVFYKIDEERMFRYEGIANQIFPGVRSLMKILYDQGIYVSINSFNVRPAWRWIEKDFFNLNFNGFIKYSKIDHGSDRTNQKGIWTREIIDQWNQNEAQAQPIQNEEVLFVDDSVFNQKAVQKICPGIHVCYPPTSEFFPNKMLTILEFMDTLRSNISMNSGDPQ